MLTNLDLQMNLNFIQFVFYILFLPCGLSALFVYLIILFSKKYHIYDTTGGRKIHSGNIPRLGGIGFVSAYLIAFSIFHFRFPDFRLLQSNFFYVIVGATFIFIMGAWDDLKNWRAIYKLLIQCVATVLVLYAGFRFRGFSVGTKDIFINFGYAGYVLTFFWIIGITNAINLMDGIDGQAAILTISLLISYSVIFAVQGLNIAIIYICILLIFVLVGFLFFNLAKPNAKIFMGDCGSQFLGFTVAILPLLHQSNNSEAIKLPFAAIFLMLPIFDTFAAIWRRMREKRSISDADKFHLHHKLMLMGFSSRKALALFILLQTIINIFVTIAILRGGFTAIFIIIGLILLGVLFFALIHYKKEELISENKNNHLQRHC